MNILCVFAGQGYKEPHLFTLFQEDQQALNIIRDFSTAMHIDLLQPKLALSDPYQAQSIIGAYQYTLFSVLKPLLNKHQVTCAGYSLGEVNAFLASANATPQQASAVLSYRTQLMTSILHNQKEYDLLFITGHFSIETMQAACVQHDCHIAIINTPQHLLLGGTRSNLNALLSNRSNYHISNAKFLEIYLPSHTPLYTDKKDQLRCFLDKTITGALQYPILSPIQLEKIYDSTEEKKLLDQELYTTIQWHSVCELIKEYRYDLIIDLGPGDAMTGLLNLVRCEELTTPILTLSRYNSFSGLLATVNPIL